MVDLEGVLEFGDGVGVVVKVGGIGGGGVGGGVSGCGGHGCCCWFWDGKKVAESGRLMVRGESKACLNGCRFNGLGRFFPYQVEARSGGD